MIKEIECKFDINKFDIILDKEDYSSEKYKDLNFKDGVYETPLYDKFIEKYIGGKLLLFVVPSRWFIGGKGLDGFRNFMINRKDIVFIQHEENSKK